MLCPSCQSENDPGAQVCFQCRTVLAAVTRGTVLASRYEILRPLGSGGMGTVYEARDRVLDEIVALKILRADVAGTPEMAQRFRSEIKLARRVSHANVCRIHEWGEDGSLQFISMERVEGTTLKDLVKRRGALPPAEAFDVAVQVADGLEAIHRAGIVHRDLKSLNVMIDERGTVRVMDFGIAKRLATDTSGAPDSSGYVMGTPEYMSPEQARGRPVDARSDVYALGVLAFEAFAGRVPFRGDTPVATLLLHLEAPPPLEGPQAPPLPAALVPVLRKALAKSPADRYDSARDVAEALRAARQATVPATARLAPVAPGPSAGPARVARRTPAWLAAMAVALLAGAAGLVLGLRARHRPEDGATPPPVTVPATTARPTPAASSPSSAPVSVQGPPAGIRRTERGGSPAPGITAPVATAPRVPRPELREEEPVPQATASPAAPPAVTPPPPSTALPTAPAGPAASPAPPPPSTSTPAGALSLQASPWADVQVDGRLVGQTPLVLEVPAGVHAVVLVHPDYQPYHRKVTIRPGETTRLAVDLETQGVRRRR